MKCRVCGEECAPFMSFGKMPLANGFLTENDIEKEYFYELSPVFCNNCKTFQIESQPEPEAMFHDEYAFFSRTSERMKEHFNKYSSWLKSTYLNQRTDPFIIEIGSNDGIFLENFAKEGIKHLGIEPSGNVAEEARKHGVNTVVEFFTESLSSEIKEKHGEADIICAANVMCHIPDLNEIGKNANILLKANGLLIFEDPYLGSMIEKTSYDQIYDEHVYIFSAIAVSKIFAAHGFELIDTIQLETHGGSMRYVLGRKGKWDINDRLIKTLQKEKELGLDSPKTYDLFRKSCEESKERLRKALQLEKINGRRVVGYGATSKSTTILNYCEIGSELIDYISDTTPIKQGKLTPGMHIPVKAYSEFCNEHPDTAILFAWNHRKEIMEKEKEFTSSGRKWLSPI